MIRSETGCDGLIGQNLLHSWLSIRNAASSSSAVNYYYHHHHHYRNLPHCIMILNSFYLNCRRGKCLCTGQIERAFLAVTQIQTLELKFGSICILDSRYLIPWSFQGVSMVQLCKVLALNLNWKLVSGNIKFFDICMSVGTVLSTTGNDHCPNIILLCKWKHLFNNYPHIIIYWAYTGKWLAW